MFCLVVVVVNVDLWFLFSISADTGAVLAWNRINHMLTCRSLSLSVLFREGGREVVRDGKRI